MVKLGTILVAILAGCSAFPTNEPEQDIQAFQAYDPEEDNRELPAYEPEEDNQAFPAFEPEEDNQELPLYEPEEDNQEFPNYEPDEDMSIFFDRVDPNARIIGGTQAANGAHPWMGALTSGAVVRSFSCGCSVISRRTILTAAHCITGFVSGNTIAASLRVTVGTNRWNSDGTMFAFQRHVIHPSYNPNTIKNDIAVLHTSAVITFTNLIRAIPLGWDFVGGNVNSRVAGWGRVSVGGALSPTLLQLNVATVEGNRCAQEVQRVAASLGRRVPAVNPAVEVCTFHSRNHGTCHGDSGSALVRTDRSQQIGVVSWGVPCAMGAPDMYARVSAFRNWIQSNTLN